MIPTTPVDVTRNVQFFEQTTVGTLDTDPVFKNAGLQASIKKSKKNMITDIPIVGSPDPYSFMQMGQEGSFDLTYKLMDTVLPRYGTELGNGTGTIDKTLCFLVSRKLNGVDMFRLFKDCITESISLKFGEFYEVTHTFFCPDIRPWVTLATLKTQLGVSGSVQFAPALTGNPWSNLSSGTTTPITINGVNTYDLEGLTVNFARNPIKQKPMGNFFAKYVRAGNRNITGTLEVDLEDVTLDTAMDNFTNTTIVFRVFAGTPNVDLTLNGVRFESNDDDIAAGDNSVSKISLPFKVANGSLSAYP